MDTEEKKDVSRGGMPHAAWSEEKGALVDRMAESIVGIMRERHDCAPQDLLAKGFLPEEVERHWAMARALAQVELNIMDS
jgi:hypothetical protein